MSADGFVFRPCPCCGSSAARGEVIARQPGETLPFETLRRSWSGLLGSSAFFTYHRCAECGLLYNPIYFGEAQLAELYARMAPNMDLVASEAIAATQRGYFDRAAASAPLEGGYLELGPDVGYLAAQAARRGTFDHFWLVEPNRTAHDALRAATANRPTRILAEMDDLSPIPDRSIGLAVMIHVLDHLLDPAAMLAAIRAKLSPGGALLIVTHNERSLLRRAMGRRWPPFCLQHPELYNPATMRTLLARAGFDAVIVERSRNHFPLEFLARQAASGLGLKLRRLPLPAVTVGLRLGNMLTLAAAPGEASAQRPAERLRAA